MTLVYFKDLSAFSPLGPKRHLGYDISDKTDGMTTDQSLHPNNQGKNR